MGDEKQPYDLVPIDPQPPVTRPVGPLPTPAGAPAAPPPTPGAVGTGKPPLLDEFDDDADFSRDPEVEQALKGVKGAISGDARPGDTRPVFVKPGAGTAQVWAIVGLVLLVGGVIAAAVNATHLPVVAALLVVYSACLHTVTGVAAAAVGALLTQRRVGSLSLAAARMLTAVAAFLLVANLRITLLGGPGLLWEEFTLAALVYAGAVAALFRLWGRDLAYLICSHFLLWIVVQIGMSLSAWMSSTAPPVA